MPTLPTRLICILWMLLLPFVAVAQEASPATIPVVGVSGSDVTSQSAMHLIIAMAKRGTYPVLLKPTRDADQVRAQLQHVNAIILAGNSLDINPDDYGMRKIHPKTINEDTKASGRLRSDHEYALLDGVFERSIPFLGVCGGHQRLNIHRHAEDGGTLVQHVEGQNQYLLQGDAYDPKLPVDTIRIDEESQLAALPRTPLRFKENSLHHQAIGKVRRGFRVAARSETYGGTIEAIEPEPDGPYAGHPLLIGVQWHPEYEASLPSESLLDLVAAKAKAHAAQHPVRVEDVLQYDRITPLLRRVIEVQAKAHQR